MVRDATNSDNDGRYVDAGRLDDPAILHQLVPAARDLFRLYTFGVT